MLFEKKVIGIYKEQLFARKDNSQGIFYFSPEDFPGLQAYPYSFQAEAGHTLRGWFYCYENPVPGRLLVFDHGMGNGHRAYMRELEQLAKAGFLVFSYDHTGCMASEGAGTNGFAQSLSDLNASLQALKKEPALRDRSISVIGHSWGGFSTMNITAFHPEITHVVAMSGFVSVQRMLEQTVRGILTPFRRTVWNLECRTNPTYVNCDALETLRHTKAKVLLIHSDDDATVKPEFHFAPLAQALTGKENIRLHLEHGKDHNPTYSCEAVRYKNDFFAQLQKQKKKGELSTPEQRKAFMDSFDWWRMTQQDESVWNRIRDFLLDV